MVSVAAELGVSAVVEDSSGNAGASVAAYAARAGIEAHVFAPADAPAAKLSQIRVYGARTHLIEGPRQAATDAAVAYCEARGMVYASHNLSPYFLEGTKTFAYEAARQLADDPPQHLVAPVGNGSLATGPWKGFQELSGAGLIGDVPRIHAVQARAVMPVAAAYAGSVWSAGDAGRTIAGGISVSAPPRKAQVLRVLRESGGMAVAVGTTISRGGSGCSRRRRASTRSRRPRRRSRDCRTSRRAAWWARTTACWWPSRGAG